MRDHESALLQYRPAAPSASTNAFSASIHLSCHFFYFTVKWNRGYIVSGTTFQHFGYSWVHPGTPEFTPAPVSVRKILVPDPPMNGEILSELSIVDRYFIERLLKWSVENSILMKVFMTRTCPLPMAKLLLLLLYTDITFLAPPLVPGASQIEKQQVAATTSGKFSFEFCSVCHADECAKYYNATVQWPRPGPAPPPSQMVGQRFLRGATGGGGADFGGTLGGGSRGSHTGLQLAHGYNGKPAKNCRTVRPSVDKAGDKKTTVTTIGEVCCCPEKGTWWRS